MGTINYKSGKILTLGVKPYDANDFLNDPETCVDISELYKEDYYVIIEDVVSKYYFKHFEIGLEYGYYEGFCLPVNGVDYLYFDDYREKKEALKEATLLKKMLLECVDYGLVRVSHGWCTCYSSRDESIQAIHKAIDEIKAEIQAKPTSKQYFKNKRGHNSVSLC